MPAFLFSCSSPSPSLYSFAAPLMPPVGFRSLYAMDDAGVQLAWKDLNVNETGFLLEKSSDAGVSYTTLATLPPDTETYTDTDITADSSYLYRLSVQRDTKSGDPVTFTAEVDEATVITTSIDIIDVSVAPTVTKGDFDVRFTILSSSITTFIGGIYNLFTLFDIGPYSDPGVGLGGLRVLQLEYISNDIDMSLFNRSDDKGGTFFSQDAGEYFSTNRKDYFGKKLRFRFEGVSFAVAYPFQHYLHPYPLTPAAVTGLKAEVQTDTASKTDTLTVSWTAPAVSDLGNNPVEGYLIEYSNPQSEDWMPVAYVSDTAHSVTLQEGETLPANASVRVRAVNLAGLSEFAETEIQPGA